MSDRVDNLVASMTLDEKASLSAGTDMWHGTGVERLGVPALKLSDGPVGVRGDRWVGTTSACTPCGTALGSTWNPELLREIGRVLGDEARSKSVNIVLAPTVNLHRNALAGRNFECFSEDPHLTARSAVAVIEGIESTGVGACIKHFVANDSEYQRHTISSEVGERVLRELYLIPFEAAVAETMVTSVMSAYNRLNGIYCAENRHLLIDILKDEWGFEGLVISDWWGTMSSASAEDGLDLEMPGPAVHMGPFLVDRVASGELSVDVIDGKARRILAASEKLGLLDMSSREPERSEDRADHSAVLRRAAQESIVLLRNDLVGGSHVLPLGVSTLRRVAVIGPSADVPAALGGGSAAVNPHHVTTIRDALRAALPEQIEMVHEVGTVPYRTIPPVDRRRLSTGDGSIRTSVESSGEGVNHGGLKVEYFDNRNFDGQPAHVEYIATPRLNWLGEFAAPGVRVDDFSVRLSGTFTADVTGEHTFSLVTGGTGGRVLIDDEVVVNNYEGQLPGTAFFGLGSAEVRGAVSFEAGESRKFVAEFTGYEGFSAAAILVGHLPPVGADSIERAVAAAADADVAIVVVGLDQDSETEGEDRESLSLPGEQDELLRSVIAANPRTVVLINAGSAVDLEATDGAPALAQLWYLGQEAGPAVSDILLGEVSPSGRLPMTYGRREEDWPSYLNYPGDSGRVVYGEELFMGYRGFDRLATDPAFCFGHGLTYSTFEWTNMEIDSTKIDVTQLELGGTLNVSVDVNNTGERTAAEVVQCYVNDRESSLVRPGQELRGFAKVELEPGETERVTIPLQFRSFAAWNPTIGKWEVEPGIFEVRLGSSSRTITWTAEVEVVASQPG